MVELETVTGVHGDLAVRRWPGSGRPVVLIHGVDGSSQSWSAVVAALQADDGATPPMAAIDLRGRGGASFDGPWGVVAHAEDVVAFLEAEFAEPVTLVGHSFGGHVVARVTADRPDLVAGLVLVDGGLPRVVPEAMTPEALCDAALTNILGNLEGKRCSAEAVDADFRSMVTDQAGARPIFDVTGPVAVVRAELGVAPTLPAVVPDQVMAEVAAAGVAMTDAVVAGATHFSIIAEPAPALLHALTEAGDHS